ncbi:MULTISPECIES: DUF2274 domain-containing protein [unclassified Variovorax]|uniref:DUF2274 domain-containing protein n=1 Tax=unclassified Variovorax TaxID=663243 RepID=UPI00076D94E6|nr:MULTISPECIES: DUF2274 domain-containing protein [unclassified Variovorax]KWT87623.1 hypothetical protein APY03_3696 [Variovorax sp. WDL1]PNG51762.1 hypothetical protein CHC06_04884 [Variovorax sp. B2]PNG54109.1 hypothetical protein CHC07_03933 [Variovorax sp. B4]VTV11585.1 hypothetical protein WDL1CHR_02451 [Variovorax sp. WDL1]
MSTNKLRLGPLPRSEPVKLTVTLSAELKATLDRYAALHAQTYGERVDAAALVPHMLEAFMARDRAFRKTGEKLNALPAPPKPIAEA